MGYRDGWVEACRGEDGNIVVEMCINLLHVDP
jgi:hypothetical protein